MKKLFLLGVFISTFASASAELLTGEVATSYSKVVDGWTYITNAKEFMLLAQECSDPNVGEKKIRLACDIEYPNLLYSQIPAYYIKYFNGVFDGMGCTVKFQFRTVYRDDVDAAFIQELKGADSEVCNLRFDSCFINHYSDGRIAALLVGKVTATKATIHDIYVENGSIRGYSNSSSAYAIADMGALICKINSNTSVHHCAFYKTDIVWFGKESYFVGIMSDGFVDEDQTDGCSVHDCYVASTIPNGTLRAKFSCLPDPKNNQDKKYTNCYYTKDGIQIEAIYPGDFRNLTETDTTKLKSGNNVLNDADGWVYKKGEMPLPAGLFYWNPKQIRLMTIGTCSDSQVLTGQVTSLDYGRYIDSTPLKLIEPTNQGNTNYVIDDNVVTEIGKKNPITTIANDAFWYTSMTTLKLPGDVITVEGTAFRHGVTEGFVSNGNWRYSGNLLYLNTGEINRLMTAVGDNEELTIDGRYCTEILDEALKYQENLKRLYVNTWFATGTTEYKPVELLGDNVFSDAPKDLNLKVYVKDGTQSQAIIGSDIEKGYKDYTKRWAGFYSEYDDVENRMFQYFPVTRNPAGLSTLTLGYPVKLPSDCSAWVATGIGNGELVLKRVNGSIVPAGLPVLLSYENKEGIMHLTPYEGNDAPSATLYEGSIFRGSIDPAGEAIDPSENMTNFYTLSRQKGSTWDTVAFRPFYPTDNILPSYVAYISNQDVPQAKFAMVFDGDYELPDTNGINDIAEQESSPSAPVYNLSGQRVGSSYRGMVVKNGRKYIAK